MNPRPLEQFFAHRLWNGELSIEWSNINPDVNILVGVNGIGKTTLLRLLYDYMKGKDMSGQIMINSTPLDFSGVIIDFLQCLDNPVRDRKSEDSGLLQELRYVVMENDESRSFTNYRLKMIDNPESLPEIQKRLEILYGVINQMFGVTGKTVVVEKGKLAFKNARGTIVPIEVLSSGEKQLLIILLKVFLQEEQPAIVLMDEPELSMDIEWQYNLLDVLVKLNPNAQFILTTHSPSILSKGWGDKVVYMEDIVKPCTV